MKKAYDWLKSNIVAVLAIIIGILGAGIFWKYHRKKINELKDKVEVLEATKNIKALNAERAVLAKDATKNTQAIKEIDHKLLENKRAVVEMLEYVEPLSNSEVLAEFAKLGF
jgi:hypothetical protein